MADGPHFVKAVRWATPQPDYILYIYIYILFNKIDYKIVISFKVLVLSSTNIKDTIYIIHTDVIHIYIIYLYKFSLASHKVTLTLSRSITHRSRVPDTSLI